MNPKFIHLHLHTEYSIADGIITIGGLMEACAKMDMPAVAITDRCNFFGLIKYYRAAVNTGIKPIIGTDVLIKNEQDGKTPFAITLLCQNEIGYKNAIRLISRAYTEGQLLGIPIIKKEWLKDWSSGLIVLAGQDSDLGQFIIDDKPILAKKSLDYWIKNFPERFYLELQKTGKNTEHKYLPFAIDLAEQQSIPVVATNNVRFLNREDFEAHEARVCIHDGNVLDDPKRPHLYTEQQYLRSPEEMLSLFADIPEAIANTIEIAKRCNVELTFGKIFLPNFPIPNNTDNNNEQKGLEDRPAIENYFIQEAQKGLEKKLVPQDQQNKYLDRLQQEINVINQMGFAGYFLIVADFIRWAKEHGIPVGPGRGSGAGSLVAYALGITDPDPLEHDLLFERFLNPERISMPDFDIDFCMEGRDRVINYVAERYGHDSVAQIITFGTMAAKAVIRDVGRVLGYPYGFVDKIAKLVPFELGMTLEKAFQQEIRLEQLYNSEEDVKTLIDLALKLEGLTRNAGKHAGGVVIAPSLLTDFVPLYCEQGEKSLVTQFDKDDVETIGLVKFDFLGLRTLTIINWAIQSINNKRQKENLEQLDISRIPLDDKETFHLLKQCNTKAVFQLESRGLRDLIKRFPPDSFDDIVALVALYRPGPLQSGMVDDYVERKYGRAPISYFHQTLKPILAPTYGVILYQEQVMQIAQILAGYSLGAADLLRRAMGKKKAEEMANQRAVFLEGAAKRNVDKHVANHIFDIMEKFAAYGFNKSHSVGYALITYQTAWLKAHYPAEFMAAVLSSDMDNTDKVALFIEETKKMNIKIIPPHINYSQYKFTTNENNEIIYGVGAIKGVGEAAVDNIIQARKNDPFKNLFDLCQRTDTRKVNKRVLEALVKSGALDNLGAHRASMFVSIPKALKQSEINKSNQLDLFADFTEENIISFEEATPWPEEELLHGERQTLGIYLSGHPVTRFQDLDRIITSKIADITPSASIKTVIVAGLVVNIKIITTKNDKRMAVVSLEDETGKIEVTIFSELFDNIRDLLEEDQLLVIEGEINLDAFTGNYRLQAKQVMTIEQARENYAKCLALKITDSSDNDSFNSLKDLLRAHKGPCPVLISYTAEQAKCELSLSENWNIRPSDELFVKLKNLLGIDNAIMRYKTGN